MNRANAKQTLSYYFKVLWQKAGGTWDFDNQSEVESIIDCIFDEIKEHDHDHSK